MEGNSAAASVRKLQVFFPILAHYYYGKSEFSSSDSDSNIVLLAHIHTTTEHRVHKNGILAGFKFAFLSLLGLSFRILS